MTTIPPPSSQIVRSNTTVPSNPYNRVQWSPVDGRTAQPPPPPPPSVAPVSRDQDRDITHHHLIPTSQFQGAHNSSSINSRRRLRRDQVQGLYSHHLPSTLLMSANNPTILLKQRRPHIITNPPQLQHLILRPLFHRSLLTIHRQCKGVIPSLPPPRSAQVCPSHSHQSSNSAQLFPRTSFVHPTIIVKTHMGWSLRPVSRPGMKQIATAQERLHRQTNTLVVRCRAQA